MSENEPEKFDVFVSFSRDMMDWASAIEEEVEHYAVDRGVRLYTRNYRAIDPATVSSADAWQDLIGSPADLGVKLCFALFGERHPSGLRRPKGDRRSAESSGHRLGARCRCGR
jgi:hypothetical protein